MLARRMHTHTQRRTHKYTHINYTELNKRRIKCDSFFSQKIANKEFWITKYIYSHQIYPTPDHKTCYPGTKDTYTQTHTYLVV